MNGWYELRDAAPDLVVRPITQPIPASYRYSSFSATLGTTLATLAKELRAMGATNVVVELDVPDRMIRQDGLPRADARPTTPALAVSFDSPYGPLRYATGEYDSWIDNLRAIALSLEALRKVDRYGVSKRGEQYRGWRELPTGTDPADAIQSPEQAKTLLLGYAVGDEPWPSIVRRAVRQTHPDHGGDATEFRKVMRAKEVLGV